MDIIKIPRRLQMAVPQSLERDVCLLITTLLHVPPRRLGAEIDEEDEGDGGEEGGAELQTPGDITDFVENQISTETEEDAKGSLNHTITITVRKEKERGEILEHNQTKDYSEKHTQSCQLMTSPPRILAGVFSAA